MGKKHNALEAHNPCKNWMCNIIIEPSDSQMDTTNEEDREVSNIRNTYKMIYE